MSDFRRRPYRPDKISENRARWVKTVNVEVVVYENDPDPERGEIGGNVVLTFRTKKMRAPASINLSALTQEELRALRDVLTITLDRAEPICAARDEAADNALQSGDDSNARSYRQPPLVVDRTGALGEHRAGLRLGPAAVPGVGGAGQPALDAGAPGPAVPERVPADVGAEDDGATAH